MVHSDFKIEEVLESFSLRSIKKKDLFDITVDIHPSQWLIETLGKGRKFALTASSEKAKSEFIGKGRVSAIISTPIIAITKAKRDNLENGLGQCKSMEQ